MIQSNNGKSDAHPPRRTLLQQKSDRHAEQLVRLETHKLLDRIMNPNIEGIMAHILAGRQISLTMGFVNPDGTPWTPPAPKEEQPAPAAPEPVIVKHPIRSAFDRFRKFATRSVVRD